MHQGQLKVTVPTVRNLLADQFPEYSAWPVESIGPSGTDNSLFRIGDTLVARFPLVGDDAAEIRGNIRDEMRAAGEIAGATSFGTPEPVALGEPGHGYPLPWSIQTWIGGQSATHNSHANSASLASDLAQFIAELRGLDTRGRTFAGEGRGGDLTDHDEWLNYCFDQSEGLLDVATLRAVWSRLRALPRSEPDAMSHGDLIPANILTNGDGLAGIVDVGQFGPGDPALDLVCAWHLLDTGPRQKLRANLGCSDEQWSRGQAWAFAQAMGLPWYYETSHPQMAALGRSTLARIAGDLEA